MGPVLGHKELYANDTHGQAVRDEQTQVVEPCRHYPINGHEETHSEHQVV